MKINCISSYKKFIFIQIISLGFFLLSIFLDSRFFLITFLLGIVNLSTRCPKCDHMVGLSKNGYITLSYFTSTCKKCGQDLKKCEIEPDKITNKRL